MTATPEFHGVDPAVLRTEHDHLARRLARRASIDDARKAVYAGFAAFIAGGLSTKLAIDRWISERASALGAPVFFLVALVATCVLGALAARWALRARREMRVEDALYARFRMLRDRLGLDP